MLAVQRLQQVEDLVAGLAVEIAGRLVAQQQRRVGDDGARDADALLLAARELPRVVLRAIGRGRPRRAPSRRAACAAPRRGSSAAAAARRCARPSAPAAGCRAGRRSRCGARASAASWPPDIWSMRCPPTSIAPCGRAVEAAEQVQQRRLARPGRPHQREEVAARDVEVEPLQHVDPLAAAVEHLVHVAHRHQRRRRSARHALMHVAPSLPDDDLAAVGADRAARRRRRARPPRGRRRSRPASPCASPDAHGAPLDAVARRRRTRRPGPGPSGSRPSRHDQPRPGGEPPPARGAPRNATFTPMSGRMRGSSCSNPMRTSTVAFWRSAVGHDRDDVRRESASRDTRRASPRPSGPA